MKRELALLSDEVWERTRGRLEGLTDEEYLWEPAPGCWTIREGADGVWKPDWPLPRPDPEPFTTVAWRLWHLIDMYGENRAPTWLDVAPQGEAVGMEGPEGAPATAREAVAMLERAHDRWDAHLALASPESLAEKVGPVGGNYAERSRTSYVLHMLDEFIHHGAEIATLRDLWRWQHTVVADAAIERAMRGDASVVDIVSTADPATSTRLLDVAAAYARWDLVAALVNAGAPIESTGRTPLHVAAGAGELDIVRLLVEHGADPEAEDPEFHATPAVWANFLNHQHVADWLRSHRGEPGAS